MLRITDGGGGGYIRRTSTSSYKPSTASKSYKPSSTSKSSGSFFSSIARTFSSAASSVKKAASCAESRITKTAVTVSKSVKSTVASVSRNVSASVNAAERKVTQAVSRTASSIRREVDETSRNLSKAVVQAKEEAVSTVKTVRHTVVLVSNNVKKSVATVAKEVSGSVSIASKNISTAAKSTENKVIQTAAKTASSIKQVTAEASRILSNVVPEVRKEVVPTKMTAMLTVVTVSGDSSNRVTTISKNVDSNGNTQHITVSSPVYGRDPDATPSNSGQAPHNSISTSNKAEESQSKKQNAEDNKENKHGTTTKTPSNSVQAPHNSISTSNKAEESQNKKQNAEDNKENKHGATTKTPSNSGQAPYNSISTSNKAEEAQSKRQITLDYKENIHKFTTSALDEINNKLMHNIRKNTNNSIGTIRAQTLKEKRREALGNIVSLLPYINDVSEGFTGKDLSGHYVDDGESQRARESLVMDVATAIIFGGAGAETDIALDELPEAENIPSRPSWRQSELDAQSDFPDYNPQKSFIDGEEVPYGTKGSSRPDLYKDGSSIEVKNYKITTSEGRSRLINNISNQLNKRITDLPNGTSQTIIIDVRGQDVTNETLRSIRNSIIERSNNNVTIQFKR